MNNVLVNINNNEIKISSREIAEMSGKIHKNVMRDIRKISEEIGGSKFGPVENSNELGQLKFEPAKYEDEQGKMREEYLLGKKEALLVISGYRVDIRMKIINKLEQLENEKRNGHFSLPNTYVDALKALVESEERKALIESKLQEAQPKVEFVDKYVSSDGLVSLRNVGRALNVYPNKFVKWLRDMNYLFIEGRTTVPYAKWKIQNLFETKNVLDRNGTPRVQTFLTPKGIEFFSSMVPDALRIKTN